MAIWDRAWMAGDQREERTMWYCTVCALVTFTLSILTTFSVVEAQPTGEGLPDRLPGRGSSAAHV